MSRGFDSESLSSKADALIAEADLLRAQILADNGVEEFEDLPEGAIQEFDVLMSAAGWARVNVRGKDA